MQRYDAMRAPEPAEWLELDEQERIILIERFHGKEREQCDSPKIHATIETQLALNEPVTAKEALTRLMREGLNRHEAIHAIGSILAQQIHETLTATGGKSVTSVDYATALATLSAASWRAL
jgi:hypothetical protein